MLATAGQARSRAARNQHERSGPRRWDLWFLLIGLPFGAVLLLLAPPSMSVDAPNHLARIDQIAHGYVVAPLDRSGRAVIRPDGCVGSAWFHTIMAMRVPPSFSGHFEDSGCEPARQFDISNTALNNPVGYAPLLVGYLAGRLGGDVTSGVWTARVFGLMAYLAVCWAAIRLAPRGRPVLFLLALLPTSMTLAVTLSADPVPISLGLVTTALLLRLRQPENATRSAKTTRLLWGLAVCLVLLALAKNLYAVMALSVFLVPAERFARSRLRRWFCGGVLGTVLAASGAWTVLVVNRIRLQWFAAGSVAQKVWIRAHPLGFIHIALKSLFGTAILVSHTVPGMAAQLQTNRSPADVGQWWMTLAVLGLAGAACAVDLGGAAVPQSGRFDGLLAWAVPLFSLVVVAALVVYGEALALSAALQTDPNISYIEGRFFLPVAPLVLLLPLSSRRAATSDGTSRRWAWVVPGGASLVAVAFLVLVARLY